MHVPTLLSQAHKTRPGNYPRLD